MRRPEHPGTDASVTVAAPDAAASAQRGFAEALSLAELREAILRRIMRAACIAGALAMALAILFVRPFETRAALVGGAALVVVFASTLLPRRLSVLSVIYPWMLTLTGSGLALTMGPKAEPFLFLCGGLFIGSLVLETTTLALLSLFALAATLAAIDLSGESFVPPYRAAWLNGLTSLLSVALPASIAGRMLVNALAAALAERTALVSDLLEESRIRESTTRALEATRTQLTHAQKMELVGQMAGGIAHDMNNALTAIMGGASLLDDDAREMRELIQEAAAHAGKL